MNFKFCFACIDNWATITNVCPLCQEGFQLITCIKVYDTIQSSKADDDSVLRDDDWCIQGNCNTLSFPSFYIDENAVVCLDGDACKIRNGQAGINDDLNLDTSIACDSCDLWYHAYCVGFVPETTSDNSWLCPSVPSQTSIKSCIESVPSESESSIDLHLGISVGSSMSVETAINDATENQVSENVQQYNSAEPSLSGAELARWSLLVMQILLDLQAKRGSA